MPVLVVANDVLPGFGVPVAAPGLRSAGLIEGLRAHGFEVEATVPRQIIETVYTRPTPPTPPPGVTVLDPIDLTSFITGRNFTDVVFTNANLTPHLEPIEGVRYVYDMFAPKLLELLCSSATERSWVKDAQRKERAMALADRVWVNGRRKLGYALGWLIRPSVERIRTNDFGKPARLDGDPSDLLDIVEMAVPLPMGVDVRPTGRAPSSPLRVGIAGYAQRWSAHETLSPIERIGVAEGHDVHALQPTHWGGSGAVGGAPKTEGVTWHDGPLDYGTFARWIQSMDVVADAFRQTSERTLAMITRTTVALRLGVPVIHGCDSEVSDMIADADAGWVIDPLDDRAWKRAFAEAADPEVLTRKQAGALELSTTRFEPASALSTAADHLRAR